MIGRRLLPALLCLVVAACSNDAVEELLLGLSAEELRPAVLATNPAEGTLGFSGEDGLWVLFNQPMDREKTQDSFRLSGASGSVEGTFEWQENRLHFFPREALSGVEVYTMGVQRSAESIQGVDLEAELVVRFFASADLTEPEFLSSAPVSGSVDVAPDTTIRLRFSRPIDPGSIADSLSITPDFLRSTQLIDSGQTIELSPNAPLSNGTYTLRLSRQLEDITGRSLRKEAVVHFTVGADFVGPGLSAASIGPLALQEGLTVSGAEFSDAIQLQFSEAVDAASVEQAVQLSPLAPLNFQWNAAGDLLTLSAAGGWQAETDYRLDLSEGVRDRNGNPIVSAHRFRFRTDGSASLRPGVVAVRQALSSSPGACAAASTVAGESSPLLDFGVIDLDHLIEAHPVTTPAHCTMRLVLEFSKAMTPVSISESLSITSIINPAGATPEIYDVEVVSARATVYLRGAFPAPSPGEIPLFRLRIAGGDEGARDLSGIALPADFTLYFSY